MDKPSYWFGDTTGELTSWNNKIVGFRIVLVKTSLS